MPDLQATGANPATQYLPATGPPQPPYNEDRQVTLTAGPGTQMYRTVNAQFAQSNQKWTPVSSSPAYAEVQNPDGSLHYYKLNTTTGLWEGSGNNAVFNAVDFGMSTTATDNSVALTNAINAALSATPNGGGVVYIPPGVYHFTNPVNIPFAGPSGTDPGIIIAGAGGGTVLEQDAASQDLFSFTSLTSGNGLRIRDLSITNTATPEVQPPNPPAAVRVSDCEAVTCERVVFVNWPRALHLDNRANQCGLRDCRISYGYGAHITVVNGQTMIYISGTQDFIEDCIIEQPSQAPKTAGPTGCTAILLTNAASVLSVTHTHIDSFTTGIKIQGGNPNPVRALFSKVLCECWSNAVIISPQSPTATLYQVFFSDCIFARETDSTDTTSVGVFIDTNGGPSLNISEIFFSNCLCYLWDTAGIQINAGQNIVINGGRYGSNAYELPTSGGGISITGYTANVVPANVSIIGADFTSQLGEVPPSPPPNQFPQQPYAISITAAVAGLYVRGCNMSGYNASPIYAQSAGTKIEVTDCAGYNDQGLVLTPSTPGSPPTATFQNTSAWTNAPNGWFGPIAFYVWNGSGGHITIDGIQMVLSSGGFTLSPGESAKIAVTGSPLFLAVGK